MLVVILLDPKLKVATIHPPQHVMWPPGARVYIASRKEASKAAAEIVRASPHPNGT